MACTGPSGTLATKVMGQVAMQEEEQANKFTFEGDSSLSGGKTNVREASLAPAACRLRAIARRQLSTYSLSGTFKRMGESSSSSLLVESGGPPSPPGDLGAS